MRRVRSEVSSADRARMIAETRRWVVRDLRKGTDPLRNGSPSGAAGRGVAAGLTELLDRFGDRQMEQWSVGDWEGFTLQALWRVCCDGVRDLPAYSAPPTLHVRPVSPVGLVGGHMLAGHACLPPRQRCRPCNDLSAASCLLR